MRREIASRIVGYRTIAGTDWPIVDSVVRDGPRSWQVIKGLCNGVPYSAKDFRTRRAALLYYNNGGQS